MNPSFHPGSYIVNHINQATDIVEEIFSGISNASGTQFHPDIWWQKNKGSIGIDTVREITLFLQTRPAISAHKCVILEEFHKATLQAQNAFLKTFEEPPEHAYIILVTPYVDKLLPTIISRAQVLISREAKHLPNVHHLDIKGIVAMSLGQRLIWIEQELKNIKDKGDVRAKALDILDALLLQAWEQNQNVRVVGYAKEAREKVEQGFPNPKLLLEGVLVSL